MLQRRWITSELPITHDPLNTNVVIQIAIDEPDTGRLYKLALQFRIGRHPDSDRFVDHDIVARFHCIVAWDEESVPACYRSRLVRPVFVNDRQIAKEERAPLHQEIG